MASQALYRKWRSQTFQELIGQEAVVRTLKNALQSGRIAHAYLFCGPRGTGKTSAARLLAKTVNCQNPQNGEPCNECLNCREITENRSMDVIEIDAASNRGIDEIRDLRDKVGVRPGTSKYKVYVLDEAHMLTTEACNALLKTLEEPPSHVIFVLATTEAHRMLSTIVSRCQRFDFKRHSFRNTVSHLHYIAEKEGVTLESGAAELLARAAAGGMRDALNLLDQAMATMGETVTQAGVQQMLGLADPHAVRELVEHIAFLRGADGLHLINHLAEAGADLRQLSAQVADYWRALMLAKAGADIVSVLDRTPEEADEIKQLAGSFDLDELSACARLFSQNDVGARSITIPQMAVELAFIDCLHLHRQRASEAGSTPTGATTPPAPPTANRPALAAPPHPRAGGAPAPVPPAAPARSIREASLPLAASPAEDAERLDLAAPSAAILPEEPASLAPRQDAALAESIIPAPEAEEPFEASQEADDTAEMAGELVPAIAQPGLTLEDVARHWEMIKKACRTKTPKLAALLNDAHPVVVNSGGEGYEVVFRVEYDFHYKKVLEPENRNVIDWALYEILQLPCHSRFLQKDEPIPPSLVLPATAPAPPKAVRSPGARQPAAAPAQAQTPAPPLPSVPAPVSEVATGLPNHAESGKPPSGAAAAQNGHHGPASPHPAAPVLQAPASSAQPLEEKVRRDPVIGEIIKTYKAELVEWKPLGE